MKQFKLIILTLILSPLSLIASNSSKTRNIENYEGEGEVVEMPELKNRENRPNSSKSDKLNILWTTENKNTAKNMIAMYSKASIRVGWWKEVNIIIWGGSSKLIKDDVEMQELVKDMIAKGVHIEACLACAFQFDSVDILKELGVDVRMMGEPLTEYIKSGEYILTF